jgi:hypothetical protein
LVGAEAPFAMLHRHRKETRIIQALPTAQIRYHPDPFFRLHLKSAMTRHGDAVGETRRHHPFRQSAAVHGLSGSRSFRAFQRKHATPGRNHQGGQWCGAAHVDRGGIELPVSSTYRSRSPLAPRKVEQANPKHSLEGSGATLPSMPQARPCGEIEDRDHRRDCTRAFGLRLGDRQTDATRNRVERRS